MANTKKALDDFARGKAFAPSEWEDLGFGLLFQADCHVRLGNEANVLACCARLPDDFWTPGMDDAPPGDKAAIAEALRRTTAEARRARGFKFS